MNLHDLVLEWLKETYGPPGYQDHFTIWHRTILGVVISLVWDRRYTSALATIRVGATGLDDSGIMVAYVWDAHMDLHAIGVKSTIVHAGGPSFFNKLEKCIFGAMLYMSNRITPNKIVMPDL